MKYSLYTLMISILLCSCGDSETTAENTSSTPKDSVEISNEIAFDESKFEGQYMGTFGKSTLILKLNYVKGSNASGFNIVRGNKRNIKGRITEKGKQFQFVLEEPGDQDYDGKFEFSIDTNDFNLSGKWIPNKKDKAEEKSFVLAKIEKPADSKPSGIIHDWYGTIGEQWGTLILRPDGTCHFKGGTYSDKTDKYTEFLVKGTWIENEKGLDLELEKSPVIKHNKLSLKKTVEDPDSEYPYTYLRDGEKASFDEYMY